MASNVGRWLKYAKAKIDDTIGSANEELDDLEAERARKVADQPWLASDGDAPTLDEVRAKIEDRSARADGPPGAIPTDVTTTPDGEPVTPSSWEPIPATPPATPTPAATPPAAPRAADPGAASTAEGPEAAPPRVGSAEDLRSVAEAAEQSQAKLELEERARKSAERLDQIRRELGVEPPPSPKT